jgi:osmotically-inducible protein OsmY
MPSPSLQLRTKPADRDHIQASRGRARDARMRRLIPVLLLAGATLLTGGCAVAVLGGAAVGASALYDRRTAEIVVEDERLEFTARNALRQDPSIRGHASIAVTSYNRTLLLTGQADSGEVARQAAAVVSRLPTTQKVVDEITIGPAIDIARESEDAYLTSRAKVALASVRLPDFNPTRVKVVTENGVVYLMGLVSPEEADAATEEVRYVRGVERVVKLFEYSQTHD